MSPITIFVLWISCLIQVNYCAARRTYTVINGPAVYASNLVYIPTVTEQSLCGSSYNLPESYDYSLNECSISYPSVSSCSCPSIIPSRVTPSTISVTPSPISVTPSGAYGGEGSGKVCVAGTVDACGSTCVSGSVPVLGSACFSGCAPACGSVSIKGQCECGCC